jgi:hypothetical protein
MTMDDALNSMIPETPEPRLGFEPVVAEELKPLVRSIWDVKPHPLNPRKGNVEAIARSLKEYGQQKPIVVQKSTMLIVAGNHVWHAAHQLGWGKIAMSIEDLDEQQALGYLIADNRASDLADYDRNKLQAGLKKLAEGPGLSAALWGAEEFDDLELSLSGVPETELAEFRGGFADADSVEARKERASLPGDKMREVPVVMSLAEHAEFMRRIRILMNAYATGGVIATIIEAVRREADLYE